MLRYSKHELYKHESGMLYLYKSTLIDAANCCIKSKDVDKEIKHSAELSISNSIKEIFFAFENNESVRMFALKRKDSAYNDFSSIYQFRLWLIRNQYTPSFKKILDLFNLYTRKQKIHLARINIVFGHNDENAIYNTDMYFNNQYDSKWLEDDLIKKAIKDVDKSNVINSEAIESPVLGIIPPSKLSGGVKTLMLIYNNPDMVFNASACGDNCSRWIEAFSREKDFIINLYHAMVFKNKNIEAYIINGDVVAHSMEDIYIYANRYCRG